jgi:hypothetical protein
MANMNKMTIFPAYNNPPLILASVVIGICLAFGLLLLFSHTVIYNYAEVPFIAWPWALPVFLFFVAYNIKITRDGDTVIVSWRFAMFTLKRQSYHVKSLSWIPYGNKQKYLSLCSDQQRILVCSNQKAKHVSAIIS